MASECWIMWQDCLWRSHGMERHMSAHLIKQVCKCFVACCWQGHPIRGGPVRAVRRLVGHALFTKPAAHKLVTRWEAAKAAALGRRHQVRARASAMDALTASCSTHMLVLAQCPRPRCQ